MSLVGRDHESSGFNTKGDEEEEECMKDGVVMVVEDFYPSF